MGRHSRLVLPHIFGAVGTPDPRPESAPGREPEPADNDLRTVALDPATWDAVRDYIKSWDQEESNRPSVRDVVENAERPTDSADHRRSAGRSSGSGGRI